MTPILYHKPATSRWLRRCGFSRHISGLWHFRSISKLGYMTTLWTKEGAPEGEIRRQYEDHFGRPLKERKSKPRAAARPRT